MADKIIKTVIVNGATFELSLLPLENQKYNFCLAMETVEDYKKIVDTENFNAVEFEKVLKDNSIKISLTCVPTDALSKNDISKITDAELVERVNVVAQLPKNIIYMFANGYGFGWSFFQDLMEYKGIKNSSESINNPVYFLGTAEGNENKSVQTIRVKDLDGSKNQSEFRYKIDEDTKKMFADLCVGLNGKDKNRLMAELLKVSASELLEKKNNGQLEIIGCRRIEKIEEFKM